VMLVHSLWDQEDIYGNIAVYKALTAQHVDNSRLFLVHRSLVPSPGAFWTAAGSVQSNSAAIPRVFFACTCCGLSWIISSKTTRRRSTLHR